MMLQSLNIKFEDHDSDEELLNTLPDAEELAAALAMESTNHRGAIGRPSRQFVDADTMVYACYSDEVADDIELDSYTSEGILFDAHPFDETRDVLEFTSNIAARTTFID